MAPPSTSRKVITDLALFAVSQIVFYVAFKSIMTSLAPGGGSKRGKLKSKETLNSLGFDLKELDLNEYEEIIASEIVHPSQIGVTFEDIGGLESIVSDLRESVIFPLNYPDLFRSTNGLFNSPKGVLLYGPPGCGKTMLAKALAKESNATFINLHVSTLTDKWFGESNKLVAGLFSLAKKLQPAIIFIDEIDSFLRQRSSSDHEVTGMMKAEFMSLWDGLTTATDQRIIVLGATNRPNDIDSAILRRMPKRFSVKLPDFTQRRKILSLLLKDIALDDGFDIDSLATHTNGLSGSDIKETCRNAAMVPVREYMHSHQASDGTLDVESLVDNNLRPLTLDDFVTADIISKTNEGVTILDALD